MRRAHARSPKVHENLKVPFFKYRKPSFLEAKIGMRKPTNRNPTLWKNSSKGILSSQKHTIASNAFSKVWESFFVWREKCSKLNISQYKYEAHSLVKKHACSIYMVKTLILSVFSRQSVFFQFFLKTWTNGVVFDNFLLIRQNHNFVSKKQIDCEWNAQMHLLSNGKLVEMETLSPDDAIMVYPWTATRGDL